MMYAVMSNLSDGWDVDSIGLIGFIDVEGTNEEKLLAAVARFRDRYDFKSAEEDLKVCATAEDIADLLDGLEMDDYSLVSYSAMGSFQLGQSQIIAIIGLVAVKP